MWNRGTAGASALLFCAAVASAQPVFTPGKPGGGLTPPAPLTAPNAMVERLAALCRGDKLAAVPGEVNAFHWSLEIRQKRGGGIATVSSQTATYRLRITPFSSGYLVEWSSIQDPALPQGLGLAVQATILTSPDIELAALRLCAWLSGPAAAEHSLYAATFPLVDVVVDPHDDLAWPVGTGAVLEDALTHPLTALPPGWTSHPGTASMQWCCLFPDAAPAPANRSSFYLSTQDQAGVAKVLGAQALNGALRFSVRHVPANNLNAAYYTAPFETVLGSVPDDWWAAANRYRVWAEEQPWTEQGPMANDPGFSVTARQMTMFGIFAPDIDFLRWRPWPERHVEQALAFDTSRIVPQNYGWYDHGFDEQYGDWEPLPEYLAVAGQAAAAGARFSPYTLLHYISQGSEPPVPGYSALAAQENAVIDENGLAVTIIDGSGRIAFEICQSTQFARDYAAWLARQLKSYGAGGMYLDVANVLPAQLCYARGHGHPPADPGNTARRIELVRAIHDAVADPDFYVSSESVNELYLGQIEIGMSQWTNNFFLGTVNYYPLFETVYHRYLRVGRLGAVLNFDTEKLPPPLLQVLGRQTYAAHVFLGRTPFAGALLNEDSLRDNVLASFPWGLLIDTVSRTMDFLTLPKIADHVGHGQRLRDPQVQVASVDLARVGEFLLLLTIPYGTVQPAVYVSAWGMPDTGAILLLLQNWTDEYDATFTQALPPGSVITFDPSSLGFGEGWFDEYDIPTIQVPTDDVKQIPFPGGPQPYTITFDPAASGYTAAGYAIWHYPGTSAAVMAGVSPATGPIVLSGTIGSRSSEAYLLVPRP